LAGGQQLARAGHSVTVYEKNDRIGGLLRYGIPDFKLDKRLIDWRMAQMAVEGVKFVTRTLVGAQLQAFSFTGVASDATKVVAPEKLLKDFDAVVLAGGSETPRDLAVPGRDLDGVHFALEFLIPQNKEVAGGRKNPISAQGKHVVVIGGGDTGSDCVGTSNRHGAASITQFELLPQPPDQENKPLTWPYWPTRLRTSSSHDEGCSRDWSVATKEFIGEKGKLKALKCVRLEWANGKMSEVPGSEFEVTADLVFLAMGFTQPIATVLDAFGVSRDGRGNVAATTDGNGCYATNIDKVFAAGDVRRGQSLVVWAIREGRQCARAVDTFLMGESTLPR
jgi:glutamate synthase (NADPH/NADH) small chain